MLEAQGVSYERITVPGALGDPAGAGAGGVRGRSSRAAPRARRFDGAVALGCVIRGETSHYDIVCNNANHWLMEVAIRHGIPVGNAILTVDTEAQAHGAGARRRARARAGTPCAPAWR